MSRSVESGVHILAANQPPNRFYRGGERIAEFRTQPGRGPRVPEDWVGSVTPLFGEVELGLTLLESGAVLAEEVRADPQFWLGSAHVARYGADAALLVKLLDAGQRLPVHAHPTVQWAHEHLGISHGKTEAWVFLADATVWMGFTRNIAQSEMAAWVKNQDAEGMLAAMHELHAEAGDAIVVPAGTPHAIGEGAFIAEVQEPTDLSILMEWRDLDIDGLAEGHLGLGFDTALGAVSRSASSREEIERLRNTTRADVGNLLPDAADFFRVERYRDDAVLEPGFSVVVVTHGNGVLTSATGQTIRLKRGLTVLLAHASGTWKATESEGLEFLRCRPPAP